MALSSLFSSLIAMAADETGIIRGKVTTSEGNPAGSRYGNFQRNQRSAVTDENGIFVVRNLEPGNYTIEISFAGHETYQKEVTVKERNHQHHHRAAGIFQRSAEVIVSGNKNVPHQRVIMFQRST